MRTLNRAVPLAVMATLAMTLPGCSTSGTPTADKCQTVPVEMIDVPTRTDQEPKMRVPMPPGWERLTRLDNEAIRFSIRNPKLEVDGFKPNAVLTLQKVPRDLGKPADILETQNKQMSEKLKLDDLKSSPTSVCGATALTTTYTAPEQKISRDPKVPPVPKRQAKSLSAVYRSDDSNYIATLTVQTLKPDDKTYIADTDTILKGFQLLPPR